MLASIILKSIAAGFVAAAPTGPSGVFVIERTLDKGRAHGFLTGLGVTLSDTVYILCSIVGMSFLSDIISNPTTAMVCTLVGCLLLLGFGLFTITNNPLKKLRSPSVSHKSNYVYDTVSGFMVAIVNPMVILIYISLFAYFNLALGEVNGFPRIAGLVSIVAGDVLWWAFISYVIDRLRNRFDLRGIWIINRILGSVLIAAALVWMILTLTKL